MTLVRQTVGIVACALLVAGCASRKNNKNDDPSKEAPPPLTSMKSDEPAGLVLAAASVQLPVKMD